MTLTFLILLPLIGVVGLALAFVMFRHIRRWQPADPAFAAISSEIRRIAPGLPVARRYGSGRRSCC